MSQSIETLSISIIKFIDDILLSRENCIELFGESSKPSMLVDVLPRMDQFVKQIDHTIAVLPSHIQSLGDCYTEFFKSLADNRNSLICRINERKASNTQMNTMGDMYDEDNLINEITFDVLDDAPISLSSIRIDPIIDPHQYSVLGVINLFQNETFALADLENAIKSYIKESAVVIDTFKKNILNLKSMVADGGVVSKLLEDDIPTYNNILAMINDCSSNIVLLRSRIKLMFRIYKALIANYGIYNAAVTKYTSLALESVFNAQFPIEIG